MISHDDTIRRVSEITNLPRDMVRDVLKGVEQVADEEISRRGEFRLKNIVTIKNRTIPSRVARDPMTGERRKFPKVKTLLCKTSRPLMQAFKNGPASRIDDGE